MAEIAQKDEGSGSVKILSSVFGKGEEKDLLYEAETPRAFSDKERKLIPLLANEGTNGLFEAFQRRRKLHCKTTLKMIRTNMKANSNASITVSGSIIERLLLFSCIMILSMALGGLFVSSIYLFWPALILVHAVVVIFAPLFGVLSTSLMLAVQKADLQIMPIWLSSLMLGPPNSKPARDLYLVGTTGEELVEALYMENLIQGRSIMRAEFIALYIIGIALLLYNYQNVEVSVIITCLTVLPAGLYMMVPYFSLGFAGGVLNLITLNWETVEVRSPTRKLIYFITKNLNAYLSGVVGGLIVHLCPWILAVGSLYWFSSHSILQKEFLLELLPVYIFWFGVMSRLMLKRRVNVQMIVLDRFRENADELKRKRDEFFLDSLSEGLSSS